MNRMDFVDQFTTFFFKKQFINTNLSLLWSDISLLSAKNQGIPEHIKYLQKLAKFKQPNLYLCTLYTNFLST